jgi:hypothetical protein
MPPSRRPRFMWRTWVYRTTEPTAVAPPLIDEAAASWYGLDATTGIDVTEEAAEDVKPIW